VPSGALLVTTNFVFYETPSPSRRASDEALSLDRHFGECGRVAVLP
jgi:hypothetical protein